MFSASFTKSALSSVIQRISLPAAQGSVRSARLGARYSSTQHDNDPETLEREKQRNLSNEQHKTSTPHKHAPGWNEHLASESEATVKADRADHSDMETMQKNTVDYTHSRHHGDADKPTRSNDKEERVEGPLSSAEPGEGKKDGSVKRTTSESR